MEYQLYKNITANPEVCNGKPVIRGMRITVQTVISYLLAGDSEEEVLAAYPYLTKADIESCKEFTALLLNNSSNLKPIPTKVA